MSYTTVRVIPLSEIGLALSERDSSPHASIGPASAYCIASTSLVCGRLHTRYGLAACLLFVQCEFARGALTVRSLPAVGPLRVNSSVSRLNGRRSWAVHERATVTNHIIVTHLHVEPAVCTTTSSLHKGAGRQLLAWSSRRRREFKIYQ